MNKSFPTDVLELTAGQAALDSSGRQDLFRRDSGKRNGTLSSIGGQAPQPEKKARSLLVIVQKGGMRTWVDGLNQTACGGAKNLPTINRYDFNECLGCALYRTRTPI